MCSKHFIDFFGEGSFTSAQLIHIMTYNVLRTRYPDNRLSRRPEGCDPPSSKLLTTSEQHTCGQVGKQRQTPFEFCGAIVITNIRHVKEAQEYFSPLMDDFCPFIRLLTDGYSNDKLVETVERAKKCKATAFPIRSWRNTIAVG